MELWFSDYHTDDVKLDIKIEKQLFGEDTDFQRIDVFDSKEFGRFIACDGTIVFSQKDEFIYDEMIVHVPMAVHPHVKKVLVIGGGDGGVARELSRYPEIEEIDVVETDHVFIDVCRDFFPDNAIGLDDARVTIFNANGLRFLRSKVASTIAILFHLHAKTRISGRMLTSLCSMVGRLWNNTVSKTIRFASCVPPKPTCWTSIRD